MTDWSQKPYHSLDFHLKETFGKKVYKKRIDKRAVSVIR